jgi:N-acetylglucosamine-6-phosphate deacetylase
MISTLTARRLLTGKGQIEHPVVTVEDGDILEIVPGEPNSSNETLVPPFFDIHVHGARSHDFMHASLDEITAVGEFLASHGVGHYLPTTVTAPLDITLRALEGLADAIEKSFYGSSGYPVAAPVGIHLEGPFISHTKRGVHPPQHILSPNVSRFKQFNEAARGHIRLMTLAPEEPGALELIEYATANGIRVTMGHSNATAAETLSAISAGATSSTHLFNAMRPLDHREPGIVGTILDRDDVFAEAICDGIHLDPSIIRLWLKVKGEDRAILVTDGMSATGMADGTYMLGELEVEVRNGVCLAGDTLAGSILTMDQAVANVQRFTGASINTAVSLASRNPAQMLGMEDLVVLEAGKPANFNIYNDDGDRTGSIFRGQRHQL